VVSLSAPVIGYLLCLPWGDELILTLGFGGRSRGGSLTAGIVNADDTDVSYTQGRYYRRNKSGDSQIAIEFGVNESAVQSPALQVAALQNRASVEYETSFGSREYLRLRADAQELFTRVDEAKIARGIEARGELGTRGNIGSNNWSSSVSLASSRYRLSLSFSHDSLASELGRGDANSTGFGVNYRYHFKR